MCEWRYEGRSSPLSHLRGGTSRSNGACFPVTKSGEGGTAAPEHPGSGVHCARGRTPSGGNSNFCCPEFGVGFQTGAGIRTGEMGV